MENSEKITPFGRLLRVLKMAKSKITENINLRFGLLWLYCVVLTFVCQLLIFFPNRQEIGRSILIGISSSLIGIFAALLAFPYNDDEEKRFSKIGTIIVTVISGYLLAKIFDPLIAEARQNFKSLLEINTMAHFLVAFIGFFQGFITTYQYRAPKLNKPVESWQLPEGTPNVLPSNLPHKSSDN